MTHANTLFNTVSQISMAAGVTIGALGVRAGHEFVPLLHLDGAGADFRIAFLLIAAIASFGLVDAVRLPAGAGDTFVRRRA